MPPPALGLTRMRLPLPAHGLARARLRSSMFWLRLPCFQRMSQPPFLHFGVKDYFNPISTL